MKNFYLVIQSVFLLLFYMVYPGFCQTELFFEDFEDELDAGISSIPECTDLASDYWIRTDGSDISENVEFSNIQGSYFFAVQDHDATDCPASYSGYLNFNDINIEGYGNLKLYLYIAEDDVAGEEDWDANSKMSVRYSIDGGSETEVIRVEAEAGTNTQPRIDTDFDGQGDGQIITAEFSLFETDLPGSGNVLSIEIYITGLNAGDEDIAIDNILLTGEQTTAISDGSVQLTQEQNSIMLRWKSNDSKRSDHFEIEWSVDGMRFDLIGQSDDITFDSTSGEFEFIHSDPANGVNYYRIYALNEDGFIENYKISSLNFMSFENNIFIYPTIVERTLLLSTGNHLNYSGLKVFNPHGKQFRIPVFWEPGEIRVVVESLPPGFYFMTLTIGGQNKMFRFIKS